MSSYDEVSSDEERDFEDDEDYSYDESEWSEEEEALSEANLRLFNAVVRNDADAAAAAVQQTIRDGANVNAVLNDATPLILACARGYDKIIGILLDSGADARWKDSSSSSALLIACYEGHLSTVQLLINHDNGLLEILDEFGRTPLIVAIGRQHSDIVLFLFDSGANPYHADQFGDTALIRACQRSSLEVVRLLLAAGADVEARDREQQTALHHAVDNDRSDLLRELVLQHNANMFAVDEVGRTPFDEACDSNI